MTKSPQVFVFSGFNGKILGRKPKRVMHLLDELGYRYHYFTQPSKSFFLDGGVEITTGRTFKTPDAITEFMVEKIADAPVNVTLGASGGGFAAVRFGAQCQVDAIVGLSAFTTIALDIVNHDRRALGDKGKKFMATLHGLETRDSHRNSAQYLRAADFAGQVDLWYPEDNVGDSFQAHNLADFSSVKLLPQKAEEHAFFKQAGVPLRYCLRKSLKSLAA